MSGSDHRPRSMSSSRSLRRGLVVASLLIAGLVTSSVASTTAATLPLRIDLRVLVLDDNSPWVGAIESELGIEGVPYTTVQLGSPSRPVITDAFLASGNEAFFQAVVGPDYLLSQLSDPERTSLRAFEASFGIREVDGFNWPNASVGLNPPAVIGDINGTTATVTAAGLAGGFGYLNGPVPFSAGSYSYIAEPLAAASLPTGASYTTLVGVPLPNGAMGSLLGDYTNAGVEQMVITAAFSSTLPQFKYLAHGIVTWATRGVHFGYNRNNFTLNVDDAFNSDASWNVDLNCTPGEDCTAPDASARMTPDDVTYAVNWEQANNYQLTLPFNGFYADPVADPLTQALVANAASFRWLNHGFEHIYQGCVQDFTVVPWRCTLDANGQIVWTSQQDIYNEIQNNIAVGRSLGLTFDATEYLSGEHSGLFFLPQQPTDNPNFGPALAQAGIKTIGSDASRDNVSRQVGTATTIPRHPDRAVLQHLHPGTGGRRVQLVVHHPRQWRQRLLRGQPGNRDLHRAARPGNRIHVVHRADRRRLRHELHPQQRPAAVLRAHLEPDRRPTGVQPARHHPRHVPQRVHAGHPAGQLDPHRGRQPAEPADPLGSSRCKRSDRIRPERTDLDHQPFRPSSAIHCPNRYHRRRRNTSAVRR